MSPISLGLGLGLTMSGRSARRWRPSDVFRPGDNGLLYDFSRADTLFQEATGITPASVDQSVGLVLDTSQWGGKTLDQVLAGQAELHIPNYASGAWNAGLGRWIMRRPANDSMTAYKTNISIQSGRYYRVSFRGYLDGGDVPHVANFRGGDGGLSIGAPSIPIVTDGQYIEFIFSPTANREFTFFGGSSNNDNEWGAADISIKEIPGNHASQATSGARPVRKAGGLTRYDGSDDNLLTTLVPSAAMTLAFKGKCSIIDRYAIGGTVSTSRLYLGINGQQQLAAGVGGNAASVIKSSATVLGQTIVGVLTTDGSTDLLYLNGASVYSGARTGTIGSDPLRIGSLNNAGTASGLWNGDIYKALAINRALTASEITKLTNSWGTS